MKYSKPFLWDKGGSKTSPVWSKQNALSAFLFAALCMLSSSGCAHDGQPVEDQRLKLGQATQTISAGGVYEISNVDSQKCVDVAGGGVNDGDNIQRWSCNGTNAQRFTFTALGGGQYERKRSIPASAWTCRRPAREMV